MMHEVIDTLLVHQNRDPQKPLGQAFAPSNIALCKYWGKRDSQLNLPQTSSLSIALGAKGTTTKIAVLQNANADQITLNNQRLSQTDPFSKRLMCFLDGFRFTSEQHYSVETTSNLPIGAGVASSACGFAALVLALRDLYDWTLSQEQLSLLARLGSGSAARSVYSGFVEWEKGCDPKGFDSVAKPLDLQWPDLRIGLCLFQRTPKFISSRVAMQRTVETSKYYALWPEQVSQDLVELKKAIQNRDFKQFGKISESNALSLHALMQTSWPPICYDRPETLAAKQTVWQLREQGVEVYFTQDAGPNLKLLFLAQNVTLLQDVFKSMEVICPF